MKNKKSITIPPRNYLVAKSLFKKAGKHEKTNKAKRRLDKVQFKKIGSIDKTNSFIYTTY